MRINVLHTHKIYFNQQQQQQQEHFESFFYLSGRARLANVPYQQFFIIAHLSSTTQLLLV
jgi:hypothetical protein